MLKDFLLAASGDGLLGSPIWIHCRKKAGSLQESGNLPYIDDLVKSLLGRHPGESRGPEIYESGFLFSQESLDSGFRRNDEFYGISTFYEFIIYSAGFIKRLPKPTGRGSPGG